MTLFFTSTLMIILYIRVKPYKEKTANRLEIFNEISILLIGYHIYWFSEAVPDADTRYFIGFSCVFFIVLGLLVNLAMILFSTFKSGKLKFLKFRYKKRLNR